MGFSELEKYLLKIYPIHTNKNYCLSKLLIGDSQTVCGNCYVLLIPVETSILRVEDGLWSISCKKCLKTWNYQEPIEEIEVSSEFDILSF